MGSFKPEDAILDPSFLWEPAADKNDGTPMSMRIASAMRRRIQEVVQSGLFRFKTESDLGRTAVAWFMREKIEPYMYNGRVDSTLHSLVSLERLNKAGQEAAEMDKLVVQSRAALRSLMRAKMTTRARQHVRELKEGLAGIPDQEWATEARARLNEDEQVAKVLREIEEVI